MHQKNCFAANCKIKFPQIFPAIRYYVYQLPIVMCVLVDKLYTLSFVGILHRDPLPDGQQFMIQLLVSSLMADRGLEKALSSAITHEATSDQGMVMELTLSHDQSVPLLHLVQQLIGNATSLHLTYFKQVDDMYTCVYDCYLHINPYICHHCMLHIYM